MRLHTLVIRSTPAMSTDKMAGEAPIVPACYSHSPLSVPKCGSPLSLKKALSVDVTPPSKLPLKQSLSVGSEYMKSQ